MDWFQPPLCFQRCRYLLLPLGKAIAIVPPPLLSTELYPEQGTTAQRTNPYLRGGLVVVALGLVMVFGVACWLKPYDEAGQPLRMETHRQIGLPACTFYTLTGLPCPSCGMTTSFALLMHGDLANSLRANAVGTGLALFWLALIPWSLVCAFQGRLFFIRSLERALMWAVIVFIALLLVRWVWVLGMIVAARV
jgi:hypothetical protein